MTTTAAGTTSVQLGQSIRDLREQRGLSLRELARRVSVSPSFVSQIELGKANPSVGTLYSLLSVLGTTLDDLIGGQQGSVGPEPADCPRPRPLTAHVAARRRTRPAGRGPHGSRCRAWSRSGSPTTTTPTSTSCTSSTPPGRRPARPTS